MKHLKLFEEYYRGNIGDKARYILDYFGDHDKKRNVNGWNFYDNGMDKTYQWTNKNYPNITIYATPFYEEDNEIAFSVVYNDIENYNKVTVEELPKTEEERKDFFNWYFDKFMPNMINLVECCERAKNLLKILILGDGENGKLDLNIKIGNDLIQSAKLYNESLYITEDDEEWYIVEYDLIKLSELYHILAEKNPDIVDSINSGYFNLKNK